MNFDVKHTHTEIPDRPYEEIQPYGERSLTQSLSDLSFPLVLLIVVILMGIAAKCSRHKRDIGHLIANLQNILALERLLQRNSSVDFQEYYDANHPDYLVSHLQKIVALEQMFHLKSPK